MQEPTSQALSNEQQDIVDLLKHELTELAENELERLDSGDFSQQEELLYELYIHLEHIGNAVDMAGLNGLASCCKRLSTVFHHLHEQQSPAPTNLSPSMSQWANLFLGYLQDLGQPEKEHQHCEGIVAFLSQATLPQAFTADETTAVIEQFDLSHLASFNEEDENPIPTHVDESMLSLDVGEDIRSELLQGMMLELPEQIQQFEQSVQRFFASDDFSDLAQAQRIAHTIKGAANTVAIRGLANLTHYCEDLLEIAAKQCEQSPDGFEDLLIQVTDCLAATADFLAHQGPAPEELEDVMQQLLDWLHLLKAQRQGTHDPIQPQPEPAVEETAEAPAEPRVADISEPALSHSDTQTPTNTETQSKNSSDEEVYTLAASAPTPAAKSAPDSTSKQRSSARTEPEEADEHERHINLPESKAHELLRLSGEIQIANNQVEAQIVSMQTSLQLSARFHQQIKSMAAQLDTMVQTQSALREAARSQVENEIDPLEMDRYNELHTFANQLLELTTDSYESIGSLSQQIRDLNTLNVQQQRLNDDSQSMMLELNLSAAKSLSSRFMRCVRQACRLTGKAANLRIEGEQLLLDNRVLGRIADPIMHLLRNAIDHGLEASSEVRQRAGKSPEGNLQLSFNNLGDSIEIVLRDDGRGLNYHSIRETAIKRGLLNSDSDINENLLNQLIFMPGFSTRESASQTSGRGIGLDSVVDDIRKLKGRVNLSSERDKGCVFTITVPSSILTAHALLVQCHDQNASQYYAITSRAFNQIIHVDAKDFIYRDGEVFYEYQDERVPVHTLGSMLGTVNAEEQTPSAILVTEKQDGSLIAIAVERILASQAYVIKSLNRYVYPIPGVIGATILGDGTVAPVIDLLELPNMHMSADDFALIEEQRLRSIEEQRANYVEPPAALIVDDSLSARRTLAQFVKDLGLAAYTAKDGFDAISVMEEHRPTLMLVDLEMPRMNGLELTAHIRGRQEFQDIPVIMITSRSTARHQEMASKAGVSHYLTKPWSDEDLTSCIAEYIDAHTKNKRKAS